ncbi:DNA recombination protein RmuC [Shewanella sairae]|uniref:DNA recombination protein RmuC n=1 Tax=Shewanella sairae TaxID=190310 RepID=A0ABQ4PCC2_9GAMM|nr:DNA recombination protein RmuC [Shewanella sairae]MCL1129026.1 DNA recombination protein RmuC [Shewanella sairae]GIU45188.1 DNA recombination protein RmuC [Shewanella sairae]
MPLDLAFSTGQIVIISAIAFLAMLIGALFNQRKTRVKWEYVRSQLLDEMEQTKLELNSEILELKENIHQKELTIDQYQDKLEFRLEQLGKAQAQAERCKELEQALTDNQRKQMETQLALSKSNAMQQTLAASYDAKEQALNDKIQLLEDSEQRLNGQFENLATKIFEARSEKLQSQNNQQLDSVLAPFKQQIEGFRAQVQASYSHEQTQRSALKHQLDSLTELNLKMSQDAVNLTKALKGDNKQQGNWGEVILERVLQESGLREGHEYDTQTDLKNDNGKRFKPDVIVHLPENKDVVIDAKMSLVAYERYFNSDDEAIRAQAIKEHIISVRSHIKGLSQKDYQKLHGVKSLDYVLMFIPLEPAFLLALEHDPSLVNYALESNIMLVSPTNLLVALRTINNIWRYEYQNQNAQMIAKQAGRIYDKLCGYLDDMEKLGRALESADKNFSNAMNKLSIGKGNVIRQAHQMQQLGVETSKKLDPQLLDKALSLSDDDFAKA